MIQGFADLFLCFSVPQSSSLIEAASGDLSPVGAECDGADGMFVAEWFPDWSKGLRIP
jgi:hypothetical protein